MEKLKERFKTEFHRFETQKKEIRRLWNIDPVCSELLFFLVKSKQPEYVLEIGTSNGFSAFIMSLAMDNKGIIDTIEVEEGRYQMAKENLDNRHNIHQYFGKAEEVIPTLNNHYDLVFIDANKPAYIDYIKAVEPLLNHHALIIADNITSHPDTTKPYYDYVMNSELYTSSLIPLEAGLLLSYYLK